MNTTKYQYIDLESLREDTFGDTEVYKMIIELFIEGVDDYVTIINKELFNNNWQVLFKETHKIKPNISMFGISELVPVILQLESNCRNEEHLDKVEMLVDKCCEVFKYVKTELQTELKSLE